MPSLVFAGQTKSNSGSSAGPGAGTPIVTLTLGIGSWEVIVEAGYGSVALGANDTALNMKLQLSWAGSRAGGPVLFPVLVIPAINTLAPPLIIRRVDVYPDMGTTTLAVINTLAGTGTYNAAIHATLLTGG